MVAVVAAAAAAAARLHHVLQEAHDVGGGGVVAAAEEGGGSGAGRVVKSEGRLRKEEEARRGRRSGTLAAAAGPLLLAERGEDGRVERIEGERRLGGARAWCVGRCGCDEDALAATAATAWPLDGRSASAAGGRCSSRRCRFPQSGVRGGPSTTSPSRSWGGRGGCCCGGWLLAARLRSAGSCRNRSGAAATTPCPCGHPPGRS